MTEGTVALLKMYLAAIVESADTMVELAEFKIVQQTEFMGVVRSEQSENPWTATILFNEWHTSIGHWSGCYSHPYWSVAPIRGS